MQKKCYWTYSNLRRKEFYPQLPSLTEIGFTIIMPLLSLIEDQMQAMKKKWSSISFSLDLGTQKVSWWSIKKLAKRLKVNLYYSRETIFLRNVTELIRSLIQSKINSKIFIDEAHWITQWSKNFKTNYLGLKMIKKKFKAIPVLALTAVPTEKVRMEIKDSLRLPGETVFFISSFNRSNLHYEVKHMKWWKDIINDSTYLLKNKLYDKSGIIYWLTKKEWEILAEDLFKNMEFYVVLIKLVWRMMKKEIQFKWIMK